MIVVGNSCVHKFSMLLLKHAFAVMCLLALSAAGFAQNATISLNCFPAIAVADGRSPLTVTAIVRNQNGSAVPDGTQVVFSSRLGNFRQNVVQTTDGLARVILIAGTTAGSELISASVLAFRANANLEVEYVSDRSLLSSAKEYIEIVSAKSLIYSSEMRTMEGISADRGVKLRYKDIDIEADNLQLKVPTYEVTAKNAKLKFGKETRTYKQLYMKLNLRKGAGVTEFESSSTEIVPGPTFIRFQKGPPVMRTGLVEIRTGGVSPFVGTPNSGWFRFEDLSNSTTLIASKKAVIYPSREIQFQRADLMVGGVTIMRLPLFQLSTQNANPVVTDQFVNVTNNQLAINYPYYLTLKPGQTSLFRLRSGTLYSSGVGAASGTFLDYELHWNQGDDMDGGLTVQGLARNDWGVGLRQYWRPDPLTTVAAQVDFPQNRTLVGTLNANHQFDGFQFNFSANGSRTVRGSPFQNDQYYLSLDKDPTKIGKLPLRLYYGVTASQNSYKTVAGDRFQRSVGVGTRMYLLPQPINKKTTLNASLSVSHLMGYNVLQGLTTNATLTVSSALTTRSALVVGYEYLNDGFNSSVIGRHRLTAQAQIGFGRMSFSILGAKSIDIDRLNGSAEFRYKLSDLWRIGSYYSIDRYLGSSFQDYSFLVGYRLGFREIGLSWSQRTKRIGLEILATSFN